MRVYTVVVLLGVLAAIASFAGACGGSDGGDDRATSDALPAVSFAPTGRSPVPMLVEVADTRERLSCGLMHRTSLPDEQGMLFLVERVYGAGQTTSFWNRNTLIPLSVAYIAADGKILSILDMEPTAFAGAPGIFQPIPPQPYSYVIEANRGWYDRHGIAAGDQVDVTKAARRGSKNQPPPTLCRERGL